MIDPESARKDQEQSMPKVREDPERGVVVDNLKHFAVASFADCERLLDEGLSNRTVGSTAMNASSSRSHCGISWFGADNLNNIHPSLSLYLSFIFFSF
jgi:hypothetical protein